jgi:lipoprotein-anchoring transpeptidase ErfK/SrfK
VRSSVRVGEATATYWSGDASCRQKPAGRPHYVSTSYGVPIPYAVFFAPGGIAFHAGSLTTSSHGCVHLSLPSARYYHDHLPIGAEVAVF